MRPFLGERSNRLSENFNGKYGVRYVFGLYCGFAQQRNPILGADEPAAFGDE
jgi:hypothetical protein